RTDCKREGRGQPDDVLASGNTRKVTGDCLKGLYGPVNTSLDEKLRLDTSALQRCALHQSSPSSRSAWITRQTKQRVGPRSVVRHRKTWPIGVKSANQSPRIVGKVVQYPHLAGHGVKRNFVLRGHISKELTCFAFGIGQVSNLGGGLGTRIYIEVVDQNHCDVSHTFGAITECPIRQAPGPPRRRLVLLDVEHANVLRFVVVGQD